MSNVVAADALRSTQPRARGAGLGRAGLLFATSMVVVRETTGVTAFDALGMVALVASVPFMWQRNKPLRTVYVALVAAIAGTAASDQLVHDAALGDTLASAAFPLLISTVAVTIPWLAGGSERPIRAMFTSAVISTLIYNISYPPMYFETEPWKFGLAAPVIFLGLIASTRTTSRAVPVLLLVVFASYSALADFRSMVGICLLAAGFILFEKRGRKIAPARLVFLGLGVSSAVFLVYTWAAGTGLLGYEAESKFQNQSIGGNLVIAARPEAVPSLVAIMRHPVFGLGSDGNLSSTEEFSATRMLARSVPTLSYDEKVRIFGQETLNSHSQALGAWALSGVLGVLPWVMMIGIAFRAVVRRSAGPQWQPVLIFGAILLTWNALFSPHALHEQFIVGGFLALATLADWRQPIWSERGASRRPSSADGSVEPSSPR